MFKPYWIIDHSCQSRMLGSSSFASSVGLIKMLLKTTCGSANPKLGNSDVMPTEEMWYTGPISYWDWLPLTSSSVFKLADFWWWDIFFLVRSALVLLILDMPTDIKTHTHRGTHTHRHTHTHTHTHTQLSHLVLFLTSFISQICLCHFLLLIISRVTIMSHLLN